MLYKSTNITLNDQTRDTLNRARSWLSDEGWTQGSMHDGGWCLAGALTAVWDHEFGEEVLTHSEKILEHHIQYIVPPCQRLKPTDITTYNDRNDTSIQDILHLIDLGLDYLNSYENQLCKCAYRTVTLVVDWTTPAP